MDGYRWQELFNGADSSILFDHKYLHKDTLQYYEKYWDTDLIIRRKKLMPFIWDSIANNGIAMGNRLYNNHVNVENKYWFSYPGRSEIFTGYFDSTVNSNDFPDNPNQNVLEFLNTQPELKGKVVSFSSWNAVARIMNRNRNGMLVNIGGENIEGNNLTQAQKDANNLQYLLPDIFGKEERVDAATYAMAKAYVMAKHPKVVYIDLGDIDEYAHAAQYGKYLDAANYADRMFKDLWETVQNDSFYKGKTTFLIIPDHGRGVGKFWTSHGAKIQHANETYLVAFGQHIPKIGEMKKKIKYLNHL